MIATGGRGHTILGIDPGTATMGWGVIRQEGNRLRYMQHGAITTSPDWEMPRRLGRLFDGVTELVRGYRPETIAVEELFFNTNVTTAITVGQGVSRCLRLTRPVSRWPSTRLCRSNRRSHRTEGRTSARCKI